MAGSVNKVILVGNLGKDPEIRRTQDGRPIANLSIATSETWRDKGTGERKEKTEWHRVVIFSEPLCKIVEQYLKKGAKVYIEGALQTRKWTDQSGVEKYSTEVVLQGFNSTLTMLDGRSGGGGGSFGGDDSGGDFGGERVSSAPRRPVAAGPVPAGAATATWTTIFRSDGRTPIHQFRTGAHRCAPVLFCVVLFAPECAGKCLRRRYFRLPDGGVIIGLKKPAPNPVSP